MKTYLTHKNTYKKQGFTLIELSMVIIIIGLIIGATLGGQQLIKQAEIRAALSQLEQYNSAANAFKSRYGALPGDYRNSPAALAGATGGDGDGLIEGVGGASDLLGEESYQFWVHLALANMGPQVTTTGDSGVIETAFPRFKMRDNIGVAVYNESADGFNYYRIGVTAYNTGSGAITGTGASNALTPEEAYNIDKKADDGLPNTGRIIARGGTSLTGGGAAPIANCAAGGATANYEIATTTQQCQLRVLFGL